MNKKAISTGLWFLLESMLAIIVLLTVWGIADSIVTGSTLFEKFFAKDNAYIMETLHSVPNGDMQIGYLWSSGFYRIHVDTNEITVAKSIDITTIGGTSKAFGTSATAVTETTFTPTYYQFTKQKNPNTIKVEKRIQTSSCPKADAITALTISGSEQGFPAGSGLESGNAIVNEAEISLRNQFTEGGLAISLLAEQSQDSAIEIYYRAMSDQAVALACELSKAGNTDEIQALYGHISHAPSNAFTTEGDLVIVIRAQNTNELNAAAVRLGRGLAIAGGYQNG